jgi:hypothetical protein
MPRAYRIALALLALMAVVSAAPARAQSADDPYSIIRPEPGEPKTKTSKPEPWLAPKYKSPRGTRQRTSVPRPAQPTTPATPKVPPPIVVPETGRALPNLPAISPSGPRGTETFQDRAARCAHQAGVYGEAAGNRTNYINSCINQR